MRCVAAAFAIFGSIMLTPPASLLAAEPVDLDKIYTDETPEQLCDRLALDPFTGFGPEEWKEPFAGIDPYRAVPACVKAMKAHPDNHQYVLRAGLAFLAGKKNEAAKKLLGKLLADNNPSAMLALAYIAPENEAAELMRKAAEQASPTGMMLFGMTLLTGKGIAKDQIEGVRMIRRAADAGSTRAMLIMANFHHQGRYGVGFDPAEADKLIAAAARLGDPSAKNMLASLQQEGQE